MQQAVFGFWSHTSWVYFLIGILKALANPRSAILSVNVFRSIKRLWGLRSLCSTPWTWQKATPSHSWYIKLCIRYQKQSWVYNCISLLQEEQKRKMECWNYLYLDDIGWNVFTGLTIWSDEFLQIGFHVLEHQVQNCIPTFVDTLLHIHQPVWCGY